MGLPVYCFQILIESKWNLNDPSGLKHKVMRYDINRIKVEFKSGCIYLTCIILMILIESKWNLNYL